MLRFVTGGSVCGALLAAAAFGCAGPLPKPLARPVAATVARRIVLGPTSLAVVQEGGPLAPGEIPSRVTLGRSGAGPRALLMHFDVPADAEVDTAYLLIDRVADGLSDGAGVSLHAERILQPWEATATWLHQPPLGDASPSLQLDPGAQDPLRIDVTAFYRAKSVLPDGGGSAERGDRDEGLALVADRSTAAGVAIAVAARAVAPGEGNPAAAARAPRLELYVR